GQILPCTAGQNRFSLRSSQIAQAKGKSSELDYFTDATKFSRSPIAKARPAVRGSRIAHFLLQILKLDRCYKRFLFVSVGPKRYPMWSPVIQSNSWVGLKYKESHVN
ncbi:MAG: hypothetical protein WBV31_10840, partial [Terriglobales bacterium]